MGDGEKGEREKGVGGAGMQAQAIPEHDCDVPPSSGCSLEKVLEAMVTAGEHGAVERFSPVVQGLRQRSLTLQVSTTGRAHTHTWSHTHMVTHMVTHTHPTHVHPAPYSLTHSLCPYTHTRARAHTHTHVRNHRVKCVKKLIASE